MNKLMEHSLADGIKEQDSSYSKAFSERFNTILDLQGIPPRNQGRIQIVADMFLLSHAGAGKWVNGLSTPSKARLKDIANRFNVSYEWLAFGKGNMELEAKVPKADYTMLVKLPILTFNEAAKYEQILKNFMGQHINLDIEGISDESFAIYSIGTAMSGRFPEGTLLIVDPNAKPADGDYVLALISKLPEAIFRQLVYGETGKFLYAHDPRYQTHKLTGSDKIIGKVTEARMQF